MKRHALLTIVTAICLAVSGCTSDAADSTGIQPATSPPSAGAGPESRISATGSSTANDSTILGGASSMAAAADSAATAPGDGAALTSGTAGGDAPQSGQRASSSAAAAPPLTTPVTPPLDIRTNPLDPDSVRWFTVFCSTVATAVAVRDNTANVNVGDAASMQSALIGSLTTLADVFNRSTSSMAALKPPVIAGGEQLAATVTKAFHQYGQQFTALVAKLAAANPEDTLAQLNATTSLQSDTQHAIDLRNTVRNLRVDSATKAAIRNVDSCRGLGL